MRKNVLNLDDDNTHKKTSFFSFCYSTYLQLFLLFHPRIPQMYNITGLQKLCDILLENPSWTIAHLIVFFNLAEHINHSKVADLIDEPDYATNMTPIQVCCWTMLPTLESVLLVVSRFRSRSLILSHYCCHCSCHFPLSRSFTFKITHLINRIYDETIITIVSLICFIA